MFYIRVIHGTPVFSPKRSLLTFRLSPFVLLGLLYAPDHLILSASRCSAPPPSTPPTLHIEILPLLPHPPTWSLPFLCLAFQRLSFLIGVSVHQLSSSACFFLSQPPPLPNSHLPFSSHHLCVAGIRPPASCLPTSRSPVCFYVNGSFWPPLLLLGVLF